MTKHFLQALYGGLYNEQNVAISGIHTHSGPGGYLQFVLYDITSLGFVRESYDALVFGILEVGYLCVIHNIRGDYSVYGSFVFCKDADSAGRALFNLLQSCRLPFIPGQVFAVRTQRLRRICSDADPT